MKQQIYFDYNASTPLDPRVIQAMSRAMGLFGNPSSIHNEGREARALVDEARVALGKLLHCDPRRIVFTSGGTEANNLAIMGFARANKDRGMHLITSSMEHSSVTKAFHQLEKEGFAATFIQPTPGGMIEPHKIAEAIRPDTVLISVMMANNEIGTIQPVREIVALAHERSIKVHTDAIQAVGKIPVEVDSLGVDLLSVSAHKVYGPKGAGALYVASGIEVVPLIRGGSHEQGLRAGTENVIGIHGLGVAAAILSEEGLPDLLPMRQRLESALADESMTILCRDSLRLPNTVNFYSPNWLGESMVMAFDLEGIAVSNGSACASGVIEPSHVILSLGYNEEIARSVIRASIGKFTKPEELDFFQQAVKRLQATGREVG